MQSFLGSLLCFSLVCLVASKPVTFNKEFETKVDIPKTSCSPKNVILEQITSTSIGLTVDKDGLLNLPPLDVCGELTVATPLTGCDDKKPTIKVTFAIDANAAESLTTKSVIIGDGKKAFCAHLSPCELLEMLEKGKVTTDNLAASQILVSAEFAGFVTAETQPKWKLNFVGSSYQVASSETVNADKTFIGSVSAIRQKSSCLSKTCGFTIKGLDHRTSKFIAYKENKSTDLPKCVDQVEKLNSNLHSVIDYFHVGVVDDKLPVASSRKVASSPPPKSGAKSFSIGAVIVCVFAMLFLVS